MLDSELIVENWIISRCLISESGNLIRFSISYFCDMVSHYFLTIEAIIVFFFLIQRFQANELWKEKICYHIVKRTIKCDDLNP